MSVHTPNAPRSHALRIGRRSEPGRVYHVRASLLIPEPILASYSAARLLAQCIDREASRADTLAFCIMPDHFHWLLQLGDQAPLKRVVGTVKSVSAHQINKLTNRRGELWQDGFFDRAIRRKESIPKTIDYVLANPLRAGLVTRLADFSYWNAKWLPGWINEEWSEDLAARTGDTKGKV